jgi:hypothetical protein
LRTEAEIISRRSLFYEACNFKGRLALLCSYFRILELIHSRPLIHGHVVMVETPRRRRFMAMDKSRNRAWGSKNPNEPARPYNRPKNAPGYTFPKLEELT